MVEIEAVACIFVKRDVVQVLFFTEHLQKAASVKTYTIMKVV